MKKSFLAVAVSVAALSLAACSFQSTQDKIDAAITQGLPLVCSGASVAHVAFTTIAATGKLKPKLVNDEAAAYAGISVICADPASVNTSTALVTAAKAYAAVVTALNEAKAATK